MFGSKNVKVPIDPKTGKLDEAYPSILKNKMTPAQWKTFSDEIKKVYTEEKAQTKGKRFCCYATTAVITIPLIIPPLFLIYKYCKSPQQRSAGRLKAIAEPVCTKATSDYEGLTFTFNVKFEKEEAQRYNEETKVYDKYTKKVAHHYVSVKAR
jgi:hypothetical protein